MVEEYAWKKCHVHTHVFCNSQISTNTFQAILITSYLKHSYAVFIYKCGGMNWGGGEIGWRASFLEHYSHYLSGDSNSNDIGCLYSSTYSAIVYRISCKCAYNTVYMFLYILMTNVQLLYTSIINSYTCTYCEQPQLVILMSSLVVIENVYLKAMSAIIMMTVKIAVIKKDVVCDVHARVI